jgi:hypothetical protein
VLDKPLEYLASVSGPQVEGDAPLVGVSEEPVEALFRVRLIVIKRAPPAGRIALWRLNLDDVRPHIGKYPGAQVALLISQVKDTVAFKVARHLFSLFPFIMKMAAAPYSSATGKSQKVHIGWHLSL